jgi:hypothetical protein
LSGPISLNPVRHIALRVLSPGRRATIERDHGNHTSNNHYNASESNPQSPSWFHPDFRLLADSETPHTPRSYFNAPFGLGNGACSLRNATTPIRHNSHNHEITDKTPRTRALRVIPETDDSFARLFGLREDSESMHHHLKMTLPNERARSVGRHRQLFDLHGYQAHLAITTLLAWHHRTGADLSRWFGQWRPPNHAVSVAA